MRRLRDVAEVARWEFLRYVKPKQQVLSLVLTFGFLMGGTYIGRMAGGPSEVELAVIGSEHLPTLTDRAGRFRMAHSSSQDEGRLRQEVEERKLGGLLLLLPEGQGLLYARQDPAWRGELERELHAASVMHRLRESAVSPQELAALNAPFPLDVTEVAPRAGRGERIAAIVALSLVLLGLFTGIGYIFASVTGEKQNRPRPGSTVRSWAFPPCPWWRSSTPWRRACSTSPRAGWSGAP
jgi:hypothetical protein